MRILVAGGAGYIGSVLVPVLQDHGYDVDVVDLLWFGNHLPEDTRVIQKDLFQLGVAELKPYDQVVFLAGLSNDPMAEYSPALNFIQNGALPSYLAFQAKQAGVKRFVYASSCSVYGYTVNELYDEDAPVTCAYPYGISKLEGENGVLQLQDENFSTIALRQGTVCGHSPRMRFDLIVNTIVASAVGTVTSMGVQDLVHAAGGERKLARLVRRYKSSKYKGREDKSAHIAQKVARTASRLKGRKVDWTEVEAILEG
ncbi:MAG: SDR family oxidoreductase, partial [Candidatus Hydrogenedentes bacterium]|nr:SDR family oxidoreductase [Candidatus Hydrogenedentota bacterium]